MDHSRAASKEFRNTTSHDSDPRYYVSLNARSVAANVASFIAPVTPIRAPFAKSISIVPGSDGATTSDAEGSGSAVIVAGSNACSPCAEPRPERPAQTYKGDPYVQAATELPSS